MAGRLLWTGWLVAALSIPTSLAAQAAPDLDEDARLHFELGQRAYDRGDFIRAAEGFAEAYRLSQRPALLYNMYVAYRDSQQRVEAAEALRSYLREAGEVPNRARLEVVLRELEAEIAGRERDDATPEADATSPAPSGGRADVTSPMPSGGSAPIAPIAVAAAGAAVLIASTITGGLALARNGDLSAACPNDVCTVDGAGAIHADVQTLSLATDVLWPIGVAALGVGLVWLIVELASGGGGSSAGAACGAGGCVATIGEWL